MRCLVVYAHPVAESYCAALRDRVMLTLRDAGHEVQLIDLYAEGFDPVLSRQGRLDYHTPGDNEHGIESHLERLHWAEALIFVYPTWWYSLPAMLKGWLDRVWIPHVTFTMPTANQPIRGKMQHIRRLAIVTTAGSSRLWLALMGNPGQRTIMRGLRVLCSPRCRTLWLAHHKIDTSTPASRAAFLDRVARKLAQI